MDLFAKTQEISDILKSLQSDVNFSKVHTDLMQSALKHFRNKQFENVYWYMNEMSDMPHILGETLNKVQDVKALIAQVIDATKQPRKLRNGRGSAVQHKALTVSYQDRFEYRRFFDALEQYVSTGEISDIFVGEYPDCFDINACERFGGSNLNGCIVMSFYLPPKHVLDKILDMDPQAIIFNLKHRRMF